MKSWWKQKKVLIIVVAVILVIAVAVAIAIPLIAGSKSDVTKEVKKNTVELTKRDLTSSVSATGTLESAKTKTVSADVSNVKVKKVLVEEGDEVVKGQKLVTFDESDLRDALSDAQDNLSDTKAQNSSELASATRKWKEAQETYKEQKEKYASSVASAKKEYETAKKSLTAAKSEAEKQKAEETLAQAKKSYEQAKTEQESGNRQNKSSIQTAKEQVTSTKNSNNKSLREAEKQVKEAKETLADCSVTAPMSGTVTAIAVSDGDNYNGGDLMEICDCSELRVSTTVDEYDISHVKKGQKVVILTDATEDEELQGKITYVAKTMGSSLQSANTGNTTTANAEASTSSSSGTGYEVRIQLLTENSKLRVGMTAKCSIILQEVTDVFAVPYDAVQKGANGTNVLYVMKEDGSQSEVPVTKGMESDYYVQVSGDELYEGMQVMIPTDMPSDTDNSAESDGLDDIMDSATKHSGNRGNYNKGSFGGNTGQAPAGAPGGAPSR